MIFKFGLSLCGSLAFLMWLSEKTKYAHPMAHKCRVRESLIMQWEHFWSEVNWLASPLSFDGFTISSLYLVLVFDKSLSPFYTLHTNSKEFLLQEERHSIGKGEPARRFSLREFVVTSCCGHFWKDLPVLRTSHPLRWTAANAFSHLHHPLALAGKGYEMRWQETRRERKNFQCLLIC